MASLSEINSQIFSSVNIKSIFNAVGVILVAIVILAIAGVYFWWWWNKKQFNKRTTDFELISGHYEPIHRDKAKTIKLGRNGFEILWLQKAKSFRFAFGGRVGKLDYYFFKSEDGYWHNGLLEGRITEDGRVPIKTTNPLMRASYTALENDIERLTGEKKSWLKENAHLFVLAGFIIIVGVFAYLLFGKFQDISGSLSGAIDKIGTVVDALNKLYISSQAGQPGGIVKIVP